MNHNSIEFQEVPIRPVDCLFEAPKLLGDQYWLFVGICAVGMLIGSLVPMAILLGPMMCGIYLCYLCRMRGQRANFEMLFRGFDYFLESLIASLIIAGIMLAVMIPVYILFIVGFVAMAVSAGPQPGDDFAAGMFVMWGLFYVVLLLLMIPIGGREAHNTMNEQEALQVVRMMKPKLVIPCHYNLPQFFTKTYCAADDTMFKRAVERAGAECVILHENESVYM